jgi:hypothetical protein
VTEAAREPSAYGPFYRILANGQKPRCVEGLGGRPYVPGEPDEGFLAWQKMQEMQEFMAAVAAHKFTNFPYDHVETWQFDGAMTVDGIHPGYCGFAV